MPTRVLIKKNQYYDSVFLMGVNKRLSESDGVALSVVVMGSEPNKQTLADLGFTDPQLLTAQPNDLIVAVESDSQNIADKLIEQFDSFLEVSAVSKASSNIHTLQDGLEANPKANLAVITVPGEYAAREARQAVERGLNVFLFSNNVTIEDEIAIKQLASQREVLVMGPDCGTSIINGVGIGFADRVRRGSIGVVGPSGTGLQEFTCLVHNLGSGISHAIGTGSRDLSDAVGGITTLAAIQALEKDPSTEIIAVIAKPPGRKTLPLLTTAFARCTKPVVACFLGVSEDIPGAGESFQQARTIDDAAAMASGKPVNWQNQTKDQEYQYGFKSKRQGSQKYLRGLFAGGTFSYQSQQILLSHHIQPYSNSPLDSHFALQHPDHSQEHSLVDMGDDIYTRGRPHPMIDGSQRARRILAEADDPEVAVILLDFILGYNSSMDPVGDLLPAITAAQQKAESNGRTIAFVASITGTDLDPQGYDGQLQALESAGVITFQSNAAATDYCMKLLED
ncbi:MAG TPA: acyl-CoA synthetase FdrA [Bellilinea sp.]|nr:acyl-CoA synthetase FdrA [Bellilinea sp.]